MWEYEWVELRQDLEVLVRTSFASTLDGMPKPKAEVVAYLQGEFKTEPVRHLAWSAYFPKQANEQSILPVSADLFQARVMVEKYLRQLPHEDTSAPPGALC